MTQASAYDHMMQLREAQNLDLLSPKFGFLVIFLSQSRQCLLALSFPQHKHMNLFNTINQRQLYVQQSSHGAYSKVKSRQYGGNQPLYH